MAPANGSRRQANCPTELDNFNYLLQPGTQEPVEYIPVDDFFDQVCRSSSISDTMWHAQQPRKLSLEV